MEHSTAETKRKEKQPVEKLISLAPLTEAEAVRGLLQVKPMKSEAIKKASKNRRAKKAGRR